MGKFNTKQGQSLIEILIGIAIGVIVVTSGITAISVAMRINMENKATQTVTFLAKQVTDEVKSIADSDWSKIYNLSPKGTDSQYYPTASGTVLVISSGVTTTIMEGITYTYYFSVENVKRTRCGLGEVSTGDIASCPTTFGAAENEVYEDPSTQKITAHIEWSGNKSLTKVQLISRLRNLIFWQTDWFGGDDQEAFSTTSGNTIVNNKFFTSSFSIDYTSPGLIKLRVSSDGNLTSSIYDTFATSGAAFNSIVWQGIKPSGSDVKFQIAVSNCSNGATNPPTCSSGSWAYTGPDGSDTTFYNPTVNVSLPLNPKYLNNYRYIRYKAFLVKGDVDSPEVNDVIINWSP